MAHMAFLYSSLVEREPISLDVVMFFLSKKKKNANEGF